MLTVAVEYVDGSILTAPAEEWPSLRADGVYSVWLRNESGPTFLSGRSAYWLYHEGDLWVAGAASFGYDRELPPEVILHPDGAQSTRRIKFVPDLEHSAIKLGWWRGEVIRRG